MKNPLILVNTVVSFMKTTFIELFKNQNEAKIVLERMNTCN